MSISLLALAFVSVLLLATDSFTVSDFESFQCSSRSSVLFSPAVDSTLILPTVGCALVLPAVGHALSVLMIFSCCWVCSSRGPRTRVVFLLLGSVSDSSHHWLFGCGCVSASSSVTLW